MMKKRTFSNYFFSVTNTYLIRICDNVIMTIVLKCICTVHPRRCVIWANATILATTWLGHRMAYCAFLLERR